MALKTTLSLKQTQRIALTPELRQSLNLLRLPMQDLLEHIHSEFLDNPLLKISEPSTGKHSTSAYDFALSSIAETITLGESIRRQLATLPLTPQIKGAAFYLTGDLSEDGFLETIPDETAAALGVSNACINAAIKAIQSCEPTGVGARNLTECLLLQMVEKGVDRETARGALEHIQLLLDGDWDTLSGLLDTSKDELIHLAALLPTLNPKPVTNQNTVQHPMVADVIVEDEKSRGLTVSLSKQYLPDLSIDTALLSSAKSDKASTEYIETQHARARNLIRAVQYRGETLLRIGRVIATQQYRFFIDGPDHLAPLTRAAIADHLSLHPSTVGRAIADKNIEFNGALYPLGFFLGSGLNKGASGHVSAYSVQRTIRRMIAREFNGAPLSDDAIVKELRANGVDIARRTVAKYRGCMNIPSSFVRRQIAATPPATRRSPGRKKYVNK
ncbi:MAG: RNA polymerase factor sigma-54 [Marinosulfonomonas sp.]|nr:RNA polymerase factor sigma-54 [Marinosulfonomonas sp.]